MGCIEAVDHLGKEVLAVVVRGGFLNVVVERALAAVARGVFPGIAVLVPVRVVVPFDLDAGDGLVYEFGVGCIGVWVDVGVQGDVHVDEMVVGPHVIFADEGVDVSMVYSVAIKKVLLEADVIDSAAGEGWVWIV